MCLNDPTQAPNLGVGWPPSGSLPFLLCQSDLTSLCTCPCVCGWPICPSASVLLGWVWGGAWFSLTPERAGHKPVGRGPGNRHWASFCRRECAREGLHTCTFPCPSAHTPLSQRGAASQPPPRLSLWPWRGTEPADAPFSSVAPVCDCAVAQPDCTSTSLQFCSSPLPWLPSPPSRSPTPGSLPLPPEALATSSPTGWVCATTSPYISLHHSGAASVSAPSDCSHISPSPLPWLPRTLRLFLCLLISPMSSSPPSSCASDLGLPWAATAITLCDTIEWGPFACLCSPPPRL